MSSPSRIAATRPSIMSEGATMSAPARAWATASRARSGRVASLSTTRPGGTAPPGAPRALRGGLIRPPLRATPRLRDAGAGGLQDPAVAVVRVLAHADVGHH